MANPRDGGVRMRYGNPKPAHAQRAPTARLDRLSNCHEFVKMAERWIPHSIASP